MKKTCPRPLNRKKSGFTLVELLVTFSVITLLFTIGFASYQEFNRRQIVSQAGKELKENLRLAQSKASSGEKPTGCTGTLNGWQVVFQDTSSYQIQAVCPNTVNFKTVPYPPGVAKTAGPPKVFFKVLSRGVDNSGTITISGFGTRARVTVTSAGEIRIRP